ncbi:MAG TPA: hypothetical protein VLL07_00085, partial [Pontiella sp.]|nr:hypothetical protein [Pontiella sp.]
MSLANADVIWPAEAEWNALMQGDNFYYDAVGDTTPAAIDLVGTTDTYSAGYWALVEKGHVSGGVTNDAFMFRLRVGNDGGSPLKPYVWQVSLDTDGDASSIEWILELIQSGPPNKRGVELIQTSVSGPTLSDIDTAGNTAAWQGDLSLYSRWNSIAGSSDYHVDIAVPWDTFTSITDVTELGQLRAVLSTSVNQQNISGGDAPLGADLSEQISNVISDTIPEPTVVSLL